jgi:hypothetical protein
MEVVTSSINFITRVDGEPASGASQLYQSDSHEPEARKVRSCSGGPDGRSLSRQA